MAADDGLVELEGLVVANSPNVLAGLSGIFRADGEARAIATSITVSFFHVTEIERFWGGKALHPVHPTVLRRGDTGAELFNRSHTGLFVGERLPGLPRSPCWL